MQRLSNFYKESYLLLIYNKLEFFSISYYHKHISYAAAEQQGRCYFA